MATGSYIQFNGG